MRDVSTFISFESTPIPQIGALANELQAAGFEWEQNHGEWIGQFRMQIPDDAPTDLQDAIRKIMGEFYVEPRMKEPPESGSPVSR